MLLYIYINLSSTTLFTVEHCNSPCKSFFLEYFLWENEWEVHGPWPFAWRLQLGDGCFSLQAFTSLAEAAYEAAESPDDQPEPDTYCLSSYFEPIVQKLLGTTDR